MLGNCVPTAAPLLEQRHWADSQAAPPEGLRADLNPLHRAVQVRNKAVVRPLIPVVVVRIVEIERQDLEFQPVVAYPVRTRFVGPSLTVGISTVPVEIAPIFGNIDRDQISADSVGRSRVSIA